MSSTLSGRARRYLTDAARAFEQAPVEGVVAVLLAAAFSYAVETGNDAFRAWLEFAVRCVLVLAGAWTGTLLYVGGVWSARARWIATGVGVLAAALHALLVPDFELEAEAWRAALLVGASVLWVFAMPAIAVSRAEAVDRFRAVNGRFLLRALGALLYTAALFAGLALALAAIDSLFELNLDGEIYAHVWGWLFFVLAPSIVVGGLHDYARPVGPRSDVAGVVHRMSGFLVPPLLVLYCGILYAYAIRMGITGEVPKNLVSPMVLAAGVLGALTLFLFEPRDEGTVGYRYLRFMPPLFLPLAALGIWTITLRVDQYGWTEFRLVRLLALALLGALALAATIQLARRHRLALHIAPLAFAIMLLLAAVGPWSVLQFARRSQEAQLNSALQAAGISPTVMRDSTEERTVPGDVYDQIRNTARYLAAHFGTDALPPVLAAHAANRDDLWRIAERIGLRRIATSTDPDRWIMGQLAAGTGVRVDGLMVYRLMVSATGGPSLPDGISAVIDSTRIRIRRADEVLTVDLAGLLPLIDSGPEMRSVDLSAENARLDVVDALGRRRGSVILFTVNCRIEAGALKLGHLDGLLLLEDVPADR